MKPLIGWKSRRATMRNLIFVAMTIPEIGDMFLKDATHGNGSYEAKSFRIQNLGHGGPGPGFCAGWFSMWKPAESCWPSYLRERRICFDWLCLKPLTQTIRRKFCISFTHIFHVWKMLTNSGDFYFFPSSEHSILRLMMLPDLRLPLAPRNEAGNIDDSWRDLRNPKTESTKCSGMLMQKSTFPSFGGFKKLQTHSADSPAKLLGVDGAWPPKAWSQEWHDRSQDHEHAADLWGHKVAWRAWNMISMGCSYNILQGFRMFTKCRGFWLEFSLESSETWWSIVWNTWNNAHVST